MPDWLGDAVCDGVCVRVAVWLGEAVPVMDWDGVLVMLAVPDCVIVEVSVVVIDGDCVCVFDCVQVSVWLGLLLCV